MNNHKLDIYRSTFNEKFKTLRQRIINKIELDSNHKLSIFFKSEHTSDCYKLCLQNCIAFKNLGICNEPVGNVILNAIGHYFRETLSDSEFTLSEINQLEIYSIDFIAKNEEIVEFKTFFAIGGEVELSIVSDDQAIF